MNNLDLLYKIVGPDKAILDLIDFLVGEEREKHNKTEEPKVLFFDLDNVVFKTNQILTDEWLPKTIWRRFIRDDVREVDMDEFFFNPEGIGIPPRMVKLFRIGIGMSTSRLTREMRRMKGRGKLIANEDVVESIRKIREKGVLVVFLTNRPYWMSKETKKQVEIVFGKDKRNIILHVRHGHKKADIINDAISYFSVGLVDDKIWNLVDLQECGKLAIFFTNDGENAESVQIAKNGDEIYQLLCSCKFVYADKPEGLSLKSIIS